MIGILAICRRFLACNLKGRQGLLGNLPKSGIKYIKMETVILALLHFCSASLSGEMH